MSRKPSRKPKPLPGPKVRIANKKAAAIGQLESAILLWFNEADPISILVLASNAENCFHAIGKGLGKPSFWQAWVETLPPSFRERANYIQDFAKHGFKDIDEDAEFDERTGEVLMLAAIDTCKSIYGMATPLMRLFSVRFFAETPDLASTDTQPEILHGMAVYGLADGTRKEFFDMCQPLLSRLHIESPYP